MIFQKTSPNVRSGRKTMTRRIDDLSLYALMTGTAEFVRGNTRARIVSVHQQSHRAKWKVGSHYSVQDGRGKKGQGQIKIIEIRNERLQQITQDDLHREGFDTLEQFIEVWDSINNKPSRRWRDNPIVWVIGFEYLP